MLNLLVGSDVKLRRHIRQAPHRRTNYAFLDMKVVGTLRGPLCMQRHTKWAYYSERPNFACLLRLEWSTSNRRTSQCPDSGNTSSRMAASTPPRNRTTRNTSNPSPKKYSTRSPAQL